MSRGQPLTKREEQIIELTAQGYTTAEMAAQLFLSFETVKRIKSRAYEKLGAYNAAHAVAIWLGRRYSAEASTR